MGNPVFVNRLRLEHHELAAIGIGEAEPRISWSFDGSPRNWIQHAYEVRIQRGGASRSFVIESTQSQFVSWPDSPLASGEQAQVQVRVLGKADQHFSPWSDPAFIETGLLERGAWNGTRLIEPGSPYRTASPHEPVMFEREIRLTTAIQRATLYITAHGLYHAQVNGQDVGDHVLTPGWTSYKHRLLYQTFDVTHIFTQGANKVSIEVAEGWYCGRLGFMGGRSDIWGKSIGLIAMLRFEELGGRQFSFGTDDSWMWRHGPTISAGIYDGEAYDQRLADSEGAVWHPVKSSAFRNNLQAPIGPPIRRQQELEPQSIFRSYSGKLVVDMGQNMVGWLRVTVDGPANTTIVFRHAEVMEDGELGTRPLRGALSRDSITLTGQGPVTWEPRFTFHGFRYVEISGWPGELTTDNIRGIVVHSDMRKTGSFSCSNPLVNKLHENVIWSMRGNFLSVPTDCPQRDERLGWTGDIAVFAETASFLYNTAGMLQSWLQDLSAEQLHDFDGTVPVVIPNTLPPPFNDDHAIWGDASVMVPWALYMASGDRNILTQQYPSMVAWLRKIPRKPSRLWDYQSKWKLGDWLDPASPTNDSGAANTDPSLVSDVFLYHVTSLMATIASTLAKHDEAHQYKMDAETIHKAFAHEYISPSGRIVADTQTGLTLAIHFQMLSTPEQQAHAAERLSYLIRRNSRFSIATGFAGTPYIGHALSKAGMSNIFYRMLLHRKISSWLYPVTMGATTIWERWDSLLPDGKINPGWMTSFNHYALGAVAGWLHRVAAGLGPIEPGWALFSVAPVPGGGLKWAQARYLSEFGVCAVRWRISNGEKRGYLVFTLQVKVPPNSRAQVRLPGEGCIRHIGSGTHCWTIPYEGQSWPPRAEYPPFMEVDDLLIDDDVVWPDAESDSEWIIADETARL